MASVTISQDNTARRTAVGTLFHMLLIAAPLIVLGALTYVPFLPRNIWDIFTAMPIQIFNWITLPQEDYRVHLAGAGILILLTILLAINALAVYLRNRLEKQW
jgi:phosphate transport system permease protein